MRKVSIQKNRLYVGFQTETDWVKAEVRTTHHKITIEVDIRNKEGFVELDDENLNLDERTINELHSFFSSLSFDDVLSDNENIIFQISSRIRNKKNEAKNLSQLSHFIIRLVLSLMDEIKDEFEPMYIYTK